MKKEDLKLAEKLLKEFNKYIDDLQKMGIDLIETPLFDCFGRLFDLLIKSHYRREGQDWINWFFFEKGDNEAIKAYDENNKEICRNFDELYDLVEDYER